jgi:hypothetical protein
MLGSVVALGILRMHLTTSSFIGLLLSIAVVSPSSAVTRIQNDMGGPIGKYLLMFAAIRDSGEHVIIDGNCFSACTLVTAMIPKQRICITKRAALGFHAGWIDGFAGRPMISTDGTRLLYEMYPATIRSWIAKNGGLGARTIVLQGSELAAFYPFCK